MTAHIVYPRIDPDHPATLSRPILTGLLRESIGYDGVVITDALFMKAIHDKYGHALGAVMALQAGADMPLAQGSLEEQAATVKAIEAAVHEGHLLPADVKRAERGAGSRGKRSHGPIRSPPRACTTPRSAPPTTPQMRAT